MEQGLQHTVTNGRLMFFALFSFPLAGLTILFRQEANLG